MRPALLTQLWRPNKAQWCELGTGCWPALPRELPAFPSSCFPKLSKSLSCFLALNFPQSWSQGFLPTFLRSPLALSGQKGEVSGRGQPWQEVFHGGDMQQVVGIASIDD